MATCKDCIHERVCFALIKKGLPYADGEYPAEAFCMTFRNKAEFVEVVRCKDCKHATFYSCKNDACYKGIICEYQIAIGDENFFCACGEVRTPKERDMEK